MAKSKFDASIYGIWGVDHIKQNPLFDSLWFLMTIYGEFSPTKTSWM
jgi:hypothetical protein